MRNKIKFILNIDYFTNVFIYVFNSIIFNNMQEKWILHSKILLITNISNNQLIITTIKFNY